MPFFGPFTLSGVREPAEVGTLRGLLESRVPDLTGFTTYPGPSGGGTQALGFTSPRADLFQGQPPSTLEGLFAALPPLLTKATGQPESVTGQMAGGGEPRAGRSPLAPLTQVFAQTPLGMVMPPAESSSGSPLAALQDFLPGPSGASGGGRGGGTGEGPLGFLGSALPGLPGGGGGGGGFPNPISVVSGGGGRTVICGELHRQGLLDPAIYALDHVFGAELARTHPEVLIGYRLWASPVVAWMQKSKAVTRIVAALARPWAKHMASTIDERRPGSRAGRLIMIVGLPLCAALGWLTTLTRRPPWRLRSEASR